MNNDMTRRNFSKLSVAAFGGLVAGTGLIGCESTPTGGGGHDASLLTKEPHACKGLNTCKGNGACKTAGNECKGKNSCAGTGKCASVAHHGCHKENACAGQGGCGEYPGQNKCKSQGACSVPLGKDTWVKARSAFVREMTKQGKKVGAAPKS